jgi:hypothetical protein
MTPSDLDLAPATASTISRRDTLRLGGAGIGIAAGLGALGLPATAYAATRADAATPVDLDLAIRFGSTVVDPTTLKPSIVVTVTNLGTATATADAKIVLGTPFYINFDPDNLPVGSTYLVQNSDPAIPEMITFTVPASQLTPNTPQEFTFGVGQVANGPVVYDQLDGIVIDTGGTETELINNAAAGTVGLSSPARTQPPSTTAINPYFTFTQPRVKAGVPATLSVTVGNAASTAATADARFILVTPYNVKIDRAAAQGLDVTYFHDDTDPAVPDVASIPVTRAELNAGHVLAIPLTPAAGGYPSRAGRGFLTAGDGDFDTDLAVAIARIGVIEP